MIDLKTYGYSELELPPTDLIPGRVTEFRRDQYSVITELGELSAILKGSFIYEAEIRADLPCVGDFVLLEYNELGASRIQKVLPRHSKFSRSDAFGHGFAHIKANHEQVVAVNFDYVFILTSLNRDFRVGRVLRYLTQARASGGVPVVILTKADLTDDFAPQLYELNVAAPDVPVHAISSHTTLGISELDIYLKPGKTIVFLGMSGVGKSSLLNVLSGETLALTAATRKEDASKGAHTTTHRQLFMLPSGAMIIDTPGMRELGLYDAADSISIGFSDIEELFIGCRFNDCSHDQEPGCAIRSALKNGSLSAARWEQYTKQQRENKYMDDKTAYMREQAEQWKSHAKEVKKWKKSGRLKR